MGHSEGGRRTQQADTVGQNIPGVTTCRSAFPGELKPFGIRTREEKGAVGEQRRED